MTSGTTSCLASASQPGDANYGGGASDEIDDGGESRSTITVNQAAPTSAPNGETFSIAGTASSTLAVTYGASGVCTVSSGTYTMTNHTGTCFETMNQAGNANYYAAPTITESTTATGAVAPSVTFTGAPTSELYNSSFTVTATSNETGNETSTPVLTATPATVCSLSNVVSGPTTTATVTMVIGTGTCTLKAAWAANNAYKAASVTKTIAATKITPTVSFTGAPGTAAKSSTFTVTATSDETGTYAKVPTISGTTGVCTVGTVTSNGSGGYQATVTMKAATGTCTTKASWATSNGYAAETLTQTTTAN